MLKCRELSTFVDFDFDFFSPLFLMFDVSMKLMPGKNAVGYFEV